MESVATEVGEKACESKVESNVTLLSLKETDDSSDTDHAKEGGDSSVVDVEETVANPSTEVTGVKLAGDKKSGGRKANPTETALLASAGDVEPETGVNDEKGLKVASLEKASANRLLAQKGACRKDQLQTKTNYLFGGQRSTLVMTSAGPTPETSYRARRMRRKPSMREGNPVIREALLPTIIRRSTSAEINAR